MCLNGITAYKLNPLILFISYYFCIYHNDFDTIFIHDYAVYFLLYFIWKEYAPFSVDINYIAATTYFIFTFKLENISIFIRCYNNNLYILKWLWTAYKRRWSWCDHNETNFNPNSTFMYLIWTSYAFHCTSYILRISMHESFNWTA